MTTIGEVIDYLHTIAPNHLQEPYDNAGLIVGDRMQPVTGVMCCLDSTEDIVAEAVEIGANLIVAHHPIVFKGLKRFNGSTYVERTVIKAIKHDVAIFAIHTNLDAVLYNGVNTKICEKLSLTNTRLLSSNNSNEEFEAGIGMVGVLPEPMALEELLSYVKQKLGTDTIKHTASILKPISTVAVCGGSGSFLIEKVKEQGIDAFITSDFKYHEFFDADGKTVIVDIGHYESERFTIELLFDVISKKFSTFAAHCTNVITNPVKYYN